MKKMAIFFLSRKDHLILAGLCLAFASLAEKWEYD